MNSLFPRLLAALLAPPLLVVPAEGRAGPAVADPLASLEARLPSLARDARGDVGVHVVHLPSGRTASLAPDRRFPLASVFKLPLACAVLAKADASALSLDERIEVRRGDLRRVGPVERDWKPGTSIPIASLLEAMMVDSDNTAADLLLGRIGGATQVQSWLVAHGLDGIEVTGSELEMAALYEGIGLAALPADRLCDPACLAALADRVPPERRREARLRFEEAPMNAGTARGVAELLVRLRKGELLSAASTGRLLDLMGRCRTGDGRIRGLLPKGTPVLDKTGTVGRGANDAGLVTLPGGRGEIAVVVLVQGSEATPRERDRVIARIARAAFDASGRGVYKK